MSVITKGKTFANGEQLTAGKLNQMLDAATFSASAVDNTKTALSAGRITIAPNAITFSEVAQSFLDKIYPIGSIYTNASDNTNPATLLGFGTWVAYATGRTLVGVGSGTDSQPTPETVSFTAGTQAGEYNHTLTSAESGLPTHYHEVGSRGDENNSPFTAQNTKTRRYHEGGGHTSQSTASMTLDGETKFNTAADASSAHNNMPPYIVVYMWRRTA
jgi:hypothetical protein